MIDYDNEVIDASDEAESISHEPASSAEPQQRQEAAYDAPPQSWKREVAERHWASLAPDLRAYVHSRETEAHSRISEMGNTLREMQAEAARLAQQPQDPYEPVFQHYAQYLPEGLQRDQAIAALLEVNRLLSHPETRGPAIEQLLQTYGVDPAAGYRSELQSVRQAEVQRTLDEFIKDKSYYPEIRDEVIKEILEIRKGAPGLDHATVLKLAHDRVLERTPGIKSQLEMERQAKELEAQAERQKAQRAEEHKKISAAKRAASINVRSTAARRPPPSMEDELKAIWQKNHG